MTDKRELWVVSKDDGKRLIVLMTEDEQWDFMMDSLTRHIQHKRATEEYAAKLDWSFEWQTPGTVRETVWSRVKRLFKGGRQ